MAMRKRMVAALAAVAGLLWLCVTPATAAVKPHALVSDGMVLQQGAAAPVWGTADEGEQITVTIQDRGFKTTAKDGKWLVRLEDLKAGGPFEMTIQGKNKITVHNVLVGEVWIASGQSNMEWPLVASADAQKHIAASNNLNIHLFTVPHNAIGIAQQDVVGTWKECGPDTVPGFSAVAYFFARDLQKTLDVPVGVIHTSWGGTPAEAWTSRSALTAYPELKGYIELQNKGIESYLTQLGDHAMALEKYRGAIAKAKDLGTDLSAPPPPPGPPGTGNPGYPSSLYNGMIAPLLPYAIKGAIWYQGESNAGKAWEYRTLFPAMIKNWRTEWKQGDFPFLFVQLAPFGAKDKFGDVTWAELREAQLLTTQRVPSTAEAVITDVGEEKDIHPKQKEPVGARLALAAEALAYGKKFEYSGPVYDSMKVEGDKVVLSFKHTGGGLVAKGEPLAGFTIAGDDRKFVKADAVIRDDKVEVGSKEVSKPVAVRYGWSNFPVVNLFNKEGLPATPFRTDDFPAVTDPNAPKSAPGTKGP
jgi:sialate O-acetylesterase